MVDINQILHNDHGLLLAYDHGFEYGPGEFNDFSVDPANIVNLANSGHFTGFICQKGIAAKYYDRILHNVPLIVKLNGKTSFHPHDEPQSLKNCTVDEAASLGASGVGYVIHIGSRYEPQMLAEFGRTENEAHEKGMFILAWMYVKGEDLVHPGQADTLAYAARLGMELNADAIIIKYTGDADSFKWVVKNAGMAKVFVVGGPHTDTIYQLLDTAKEIKKAGAAGFAIGRNIWQAKDPQHAARQVSQVVLHEK
jgi:class I fructose-bisphosphate aldolase